MTASKQDFQRKLERALNSPRLAVALGRALPTFREKRGTRMEESETAQAEYQSPSAGMICLTSGIASPLMTSSSSLCLSPVWPRHVPPGCGLGG